MENLVFIRLTNVFGNVEIIINPLMIGAVSKDAKGTKLLIGSVWIFVKESFEEIIEKINHVKSIQ